ncbi:Peroxidase, family 2, partial [Rhizoctonia solani]
MNSSRPRSRRDVWTYLLLFSSGVMCPGSSVGLVAGKLFTKGVILGSTTEAIVTVIRIIQPADVAGYKYRGHDSLSPTSFLQNSIPLSDLSAMRVLLTAIPFALVTPILAFPVVGGSKSSESSGCPYAANAAKFKRQTNATPLATFDPVKQKVDVTGEHAFQPPRAGDKRGPCPGLNALANHGYLPHNGVTSLIQAIEATNKVFGMGTDLATVLSLYASKYYFAKFSELYTQLYPIAVYDGNPLTPDWSVGGSPGGLVLPPLLSAPQGLSGSHNKYEGDASATRADAYMNNGDASSLNLTYFKQLYDLQPEGPGANFDYDVIIQHRASRRQDSVSTNPHFFNGPFSGFIALPAAYSFITRFMSNYSGEHPEGILNHDVLKSFYGVSGSGNNLTYQRGYERIPDNWYKRAIDYSIPLYSVDLLYAGLKHPEFLSIGGNTGKVNSFAGVNVGDITGGVYNSVNLLEGNNLICFAFQAAQQAMPDVLKGILGDLTAALSLWTANITPILSGLGCPELTKYDGSVLSAYPGSGGGAL